ncbi:MAG TPA: 50S ribosomal protein L9 [Rhabdochlamydiaceae bacterium]|jgi:large subunit ribosomal protein L9|nr:50S ribosomal protein L9 [Rhabdochlamydiaceae bacterium]
MKQQYLLIDDVEDVGRSGELISVKPGFARNYLLPQQKAVPASAHALRMQAKLVEERAKKAAIDKKEAEEQATKLGGLVLKITVKVDPEGHMYGSVGASDIIELFAKEGITVGKRNIGLNKPIKATGIHPMTLKLKEDVTCAYSLEIIGEQAQEHRG